MSFVRWGFPCSAARGPTSPSKEDDLAVAIARPVGERRYGGGMSYAGESSIEARVRAVTADFGRRQTRLFITFALIEGPVLLLLAVAIYGFELIDPEVGIWFIVAVAVVGGFLMSALLMRLMQARVRAIAQAKGENPLF